jgi:NAD(P)-dependent dehydrogenase (short-subunit alcohol dehydrogenase family)
MTPAASNNSSQAPVALVFGATGGIGRTLCEQLAAEGWRLHLAARREAALAELAAELGATFTVTDATQAEEVAATFAAAQQQFGTLHAVANCVGSLLLKPAHTTTPEEWQQVMATNLNSAFFVLRAAANAMRSAGGSVVFVSSVAARRGLANHEAIAAAKAGIIGLTLSAAATYARQGLRVNCVAPGLTRTPLAEPILRSEAALRYSTSLHPLGRIGEPADVAAAIRWLMQPGQSWITGQVLGVDGGLASVQPTVALGA